MKARFLLCIVGIITVFSLNAHAQTKEDFEKIFLLETEGKEDGFKLESFKNVKNLSFYPDTLPGWFFNLPNSVNDIYAIGISDPDLTPEDAIKQAFFRAKIMATIFNKCKFQYFKDIYTSDQTDGTYNTYRQRFDTYFKISASGYANSKNFSVVNQHFTKYNEAIILLKYNPLPADESSSRDLFSAVGTVLFIEVQVEDAFEPQAEFELIAAIKSPDNEVSTAKFNHIFKGNQFLTKSEFLGNEIDFPLYFYKYSNPAWVENTQPKVSYSGLWSIITQNLMKQLMHNIESSSVKVRSVGQQYNPEVSNLVREVAIKNARIIFNGIEFGTDDIDFKLNINDL